MGYLTLGLDGCDGIVDVLEHMEHVVGVDLKWTQIKNLNK